MSSLHGEPTIVSPMMPRNYTESRNHGYVARLNRIMATFGDVAASVLGLEDMRTAKRAAGRLKDLAGLEELG